MWTVAESNQLVLNTMLNGKLLQATTSQHSVTYETTRIFNTTTVKT